MQYNTNINIIFIFEVPAKSLEILQLFNTW